MPLSKEELDLVQAGETGYVQSLEYAAKHSPDQYAQDLRTSQETGIPFDVIQRNPDIVPRRKTPDLSKSQATANYLADPNNAAVSSDDIPLLVELEKRLKYSKRSTPLKVADFFRAFVGGAASSVGSTLSGIGEAINVGSRFTERGLDMVLPESVMDTLHNAGTHLYDPVDIFKVPGEDIKEFSKETISPKEENQTFVTDVSAALGTMGGQIAAMMVFPQVGTSMLVAQGVDSQAERQIETGSLGTSAKADVALVASGIVTAALERIGLDKVMEAVPNPVKNKIVNYLGSVAVAGGAEGVEELLEGVSHGLIEYAATNPDAEIFQGAVDDFTVGGAAGAVARSVALGVLGVKGRSHRRSRKVLEDATRVIDSSHDQDVLDGLITLAQESKTGQRAQDRFAEFLNGIPEGQNVYVDVEHLVGVPNLPESVARQMQNITEGGDVVIPMSVFLSDVALRQDVMEKIRPFVRRDPGLLSKNELKENRSVAAENLIKQANAAQEDYDAARALFKTVRDQLVASGRQSRETASISSEIYAAFAARTAKERGVPVKDVVDTMLDSMGFRIEGVKDIVAPKGGGSDTVIVDQPSKAQNFGDLIVQEEVIVSETGETAQIPRKANEVWIEMQRRKNVAEKLMECINA